MLCLELNLSRFENKQFGSNVGCSRLKLYRTISPSACFSYIFNLTNFPVIIVLRLLLVMYIVIELISSIHCI